MANHQPSARELARAVGQMAVERGCTLDDADDPNVADLALQFWGIGYHIADVLNREVRSRR